VSADVENTIPVLPVKNLRASKVFYVKTLGFQVNWGADENDSICEVSRDGQRIMLTEDRELGSPACAWIGLESDKLFAEFEKNGVTVLLAPENQPWAYQMKILDIDGNILWLGTDPKA
jgi:catechol 2,3-dioxygenase-like lactoylglutathione lyase family enzyme